MPEDLRQCPLCGSEGSRLFDRRSFHQQPVSNRLCTVCGLVYQSPRMNDAELEVFYQAEYRRLYQGQADPIQKDLLVQRKRAEAALTFTRSYVPKAASHLDIGSSAGALLECFQQAYHCQSMGVEPGEAYRQYALDRGLIIYEKLDQVPVNVGSGFELVSMMHVLEHIPDPVSYLVELREKYLSRTGTLLLEVPNLYAHDSFEPAHLFSFSAHTLREVVQKAGLKVRAVRTHGFPRSKLIPLYITLIAQPADQDDIKLPYRVQPERSVGAKRRLGMLYRRILGRVAPHQTWLPTN